MVVEIKFIKDEEFKEIWQMQNQFFDTLGL